MILEVLQDIDRELNYQMVCVNDNPDTDYYPDGTPKFGRLNFSMQTVQDCDDIQSNTFHDTNNEVTNDSDPNHLEYLHLHRYTFLGWYTTPTYDADHPETNRITTNTMLTKEDLPTGTELPSNRTKYYALVKQDMVTMDVMFYYRDDYTVDEFRAEDDDVLAADIRQAYNNADDPQVPDDQKVHPTGEHVGKDVTFTAPNGYQNHTEIAWHRTDGYSLSMTDTDNRVYKYQFVEWWEVDESNNNALIRHNNWNSSEGWDPDALSQQLSRNRNQYLIAVYARRVVEEMPYTINYHYVDRLGENRTYVVKGTLYGNELKEGTANCKITNDGDYRLSDEVVIANAPFESNYGETLRWSDRKIEKTSERGDAKEGTADRIITNVEAEQSAKEVFANYKTTPEADAFETIRLTYGDNYELNEDMLKINCTDESFSYWEVRKSDNGDVVARSYSPLFDLCMMDSYYIAPVCERKPDDSAETEKDPTVTLTHLDYTRNRWTDESDAVPSSGDTDLLFTDFEIAFEDNGAQIYGADSEYTAGVVFEKIGTLAESATFTPDKYNYYSDPEALKAAILTGAQSYKTANKEGGTAKNRKIQLSAIDTANMTNRNRIEFSQYYKNVYNEAKNSYTNSRVLMKATAYLIKDGKVTLSNSIYVCLKDIAAKELATGNDIWTVTSQSGD